MKTPLTTTVCTVLWRTKFKENFNTIAVATIFKPNGLSLIAGCEDGMVRIQDLSPQGPSESTQLVMETKSGPIQCLVVHDVTKFYHNDLIVGDSCGLLTVFCNKQILSRQSLSAESITCVTVIEDNAGSPVIVSCNEAGVITGVQPTAVLWRINLNSLSRKNPSTPLKISCLHAAHLSDQYGNKRPYIIAADNAKRIHFISNDTVVSTLATPANVTAMAQGRFIPPSMLNLPSSNPSTSDNEQVALGCSNGAVYILHNFNITMDDYANAKSPITCLCTVPQPESSTDILLCAGHFNTLHLYKDGQLATHFPTNDWVNNIVLADVDSDGTVEVVIGCLDNSVIALKLS